MRVESVRGPFSPRESVSEELPRGLVALTGGDGRRLESLRAGVLASVTGRPAGDASGAVWAPRPAVVLEVAGRRVSVGPGEGAEDGDGGEAGERGDHPGGGSPAVEAVGLAPEALALVWAGEGPAGPASFLEDGIRVLAELAGSGWVDRALARLGRRKGSPGDGPPGGGRVEAELGEVRERIALLKALPARLRTLERELGELRADAAEIAGDLEVATMEWLRERQDAETHLQAYRDRARELKARLGQTEGGGDDTPCPTCGRPLGDHLEVVLRELREEWESVVQDGRWWKRRREQLELKPSHLQELEGRSIRVQAAVEESAERAERLRVALGELEDLRALEAALEDRLAEIRDGAESEQRSVPPLPESARGGSGTSEEGGPAGRRDALRAALLDVRREIIGEVRERLLSRAGRHLNRLSGGRILALETGAEGGLLLVAVGEARPPAGEEERATVRVALHVALAELAVAGGGVPLGSLVVDRAFDRMDEEVRLRGVDLLVHIGRTFPQVLLFTRSDVADRRPESFTAVYELRSEGAPGGHRPAQRGGRPPHAGGRDAAGSGLESSLRSLPAGVGVLEITPGRAGEGRG